MPFTVYETQNGEFYTRIVDAHEKFLLEYKTHGEESTEEFPTFIEAFKRAKEIEGEW